MKKRDEHEKEIVNEEFQEAEDEFNFLKDIVEARFQESKDKYDY